MVYSAVATFTVVWVLFKYGAVFTWLRFFELEWAKHPLKLAAGTGVAARARAMARLVCVGAAVAIALMPVRSERPATNIVVFLGAAAAAASTDALPASAVCLVAGGAQLVEGGYGISGQVMAAVGMIILGACVAEAWRGAARAAGGKRA